MKAEVPKISHSAVKLEENESVTLKITGTSKKAVWKSDDPSIAKISKKGVVKAVSEGCTIVSAVIEGSITSCKIIVNANDAERINETNTSEDGAMDEYEYYQPPTVIDKPDDYPDEAGQVEDEYPGKNEYFESAAGIDTPIEETDGYMQNPYDDEYGRWIEFINLQR